MYPFIGKDQKTSEFIIDLTNQIMKIPDTEHDKQLYSEDKYNPLSNVGPSMLEKIYNGAREIPKRAARVFIARLDKERFIDYLSNYPNNTIEFISSALQKNEIEFPDAEAIDVCADILASILINCANENKVYQKKNYQQQKLDLAKEKSITWQIREAERRKWDSHYADSEE